MSNTPFEWKKAQDLDHAWSNFDPDMPLDHNSANFYVPRSDSPLNSLRGALLRSRNALKLYFSGFKGSGKSTELKRLSNDQELSDKFFIVNFSIKDTCNEQDINYVDVLVAIGSQLFKGFTEQGYSLKKETYEELRTWGNRTIERVEQMDQFAGIAMKAGADAKASIWVAKLFAKLTSTIKTEAKTRETLRTVLEPTLSELLEKINLIAANIQVNTQKNVLVIVDDLDKPRPEQIQHLFKENLSVLQQLSFHVIYTVPEWIFLSLEFSEIKPPKAVLLPNIKLHDKGQREKMAKNNGASLFQEVIARRMELSLIEKSAREHAIRMSGGVCRELARIIQMACDEAIAQDRSVIHLQDVKRAVSELQKSFRRMLTDLESGEFETLCEIYRTQSYLPTEKISRMLGALMILEYSEPTGNNWLDVHPALAEIAKEWYKPKRGAKKRPRPKSS